MCNKRFKVLVFPALVGVMFLVFSLGQTASPANGPEGTYILTVTPIGAPQFQELITLHKGGAISETNTTLHPNSANPFFTFNGSEGFGAWERGHGGTVILKIVKFIFDGDTNAHIGYLVVEGTALIVGDTFTNLESDVNILIGPDLFNPFDIIPLGPTDAVGTRITVD